MTENTASFSLYHPQQMKVYFTVAADFDAAGAGDGGREQQRTRITSSLRS